MDEELREQAAKELANNLGCDIEIAYIILDAMLADAKDKIAV